MVATVVGAAVSIGDLLTFDMPPGTTVRDVGVFDRRHPFNFVRPHSAVITGGGGGGGKVAATGTLDYRGVDLDPDNVSGNPNDLDDFTLFDGIDSMGSIFRFNTPGPIVPYDYRITIGGNGGASEFNTVLLWDNGGNPGVVVVHNVLQIDATSTVDGVVTLTNRLPGAQGNIPITDNTSNMIITGMSGGVGGGGGGGDVADTQIYAVALQNGAVGSRIKVILSGATRVQAAAGVLDGDFVVATSGAATVSRLDTVTDTPRLVIGRAHGAIDQDGAVALVFNGLYGVGVTGVAYS